MYFVGIDPGKTGAIAIYNTEERMLFIEDMPLNPKNDKEVCGQQINMFLRSYIPYLQATKCFVERVNASPQQGVSSAFNFGKNYGITLGVLSTCGIQYKTISPLTWKKKIGATSNKNKSRALAADLFPQHTHYFKRIKDDGRAEATLLAYLAMCA